MDIRYRGARYTLAGLSRILYHQTTLEGIVSILKSDAFRLSTSAGSRSDQTPNEKKRQYFFSTSRSLGSSIDRAVIIKLDGEKLGQKYKGNPRDYWGPLYKIDEMEDYIISSKPEIKPASSYILGIHILWDRVSRSDVAHIHHKDLRDAYFLAKKKGIPVWVYASASAYKVLNTKRALNPKDIPFAAPKAERWDPKEWIKGRSSLLMSLQELYYKKTTQPLSDKAKKVLRELSGYFPADTIISIENEIHNYRGEPKVDGIVAILQKEKMGVKELLAMLKKKWSTKS